MNFFPCKECPDCGRYSGFFVDTCFCGADLSALVSTPIDTNEIAIDKCGDFDFEGTIYTVKCDFCATEHFVADKERGVRCCLNARCGKRGISRKTPTPWTFDSQKDDAEPTEKPNVESKTDVSVPTVEIPEQVDTQSVDDHSGLSQKASDWLMCVKKAKDQVDSHTASGSKTMAVANVSDDDDMSGWYLDGAEPIAIELTLSTNRNVSFKVEAVEGRKYMLGREANQKAILEDDVRVGRNHCWLVFENGSWHVFDNNSSNGTFVNGNDIGYGGKEPLHNGSVVTLGHWPDSPSFIVTL